jgi:hypothetical protein
MVLPDVANEVVRVGPAAVRIAVDQQHGLLGVLDEVAQRFAQVLTVDEGLGPVLEDAGTEIVLRGMGAAVLAQPVLEFKGFGDFWKHGQSVCRGDDLDEFELPLDVSA